MQISKFKYHIYVYIYIHIYMYIYMYINIYIDIYVLHIHIIYIYIHTELHIHMYIHICVDIAIADDTRFSPRQFSPDPQLPALPACGQMCRCRRQKRDM